MSLSVGACRVTVDTTVVVSLGARPTGVLAGGATSGRRSLSVGACRVTGDRTVVRSLGARPTGVLTGGATTSGRWGPICVEQGAVSLSEGACRVTDVEGRVVELSSNIVVGVVVPTVSSVSVR